MQLSEWTTRHLAEKRVFQNLIIKLVTFELVSLERHSQFASILYYYKEII